MYCTSCSSSSPTAPPTKLPPRWALATLLYVHLLVLLLLSCYGSSLNRVALCTRSPFTAQLVFAPNIIRPQKETMETSLATPQLTALVHTFIVYYKDIWRLDEQLAALEGLA